jgi:glycosyl transferase family 25
MTVATPDLAIYLINLERSKERRATMETQLKGLGLDYVLFPAVDGLARQDELRPLVDVPVFERNVGRPLLPGEVGAYCSHLGVWREFLKTDKKHLLVLEDDVVFGSNFLEAIQAALEHSDSWDFLKLNKIRAKIPLLQKKIGTYHLNAYLGPATGLGAYLINRSTAARLVDHLLPIRRPIDHELDLLHVHRFRHFGLEPFPSEVRDFGLSTITGTNFKGVQKFTTLRRLPCYFQRAVNALGRAVYLFLTGRLVKL